MKEPISTQSAPAAIGPYSQAVACGDLIFVSGQLPVDPATARLSLGVEAQTIQCLKNIAAILESAGSGVDKILKTTVFLKNMDDFAAMNEVYAEFFKGVSSFPARSSVEVARLPKDALIEIEAISSK